MVKYVCIDEDNNVWQCECCGHMEQLEADGPAENDWKFCPHCGQTLKQVEPDEE